MDGGCCRCRVGRYAARCVICHGYWRAANSRQWSVLAPTETDCTVCPPVVVNYNQLKFTDCSRHESTQARWVLVASTMVVLHEPDHAGAGEPRDPGVSWPPLFVSYSDFDPNFSLTSAVSGTMQTAVCLDFTNPMRKVWGSTSALPIAVVLCWVVLKCVVPPRQKFIAVPPSFLILFSNSSLPWSPLHINTLSSILQ